MPITSARPSRSTRSAMRRSCSSNGRSVSISTITTSAKRIALSVSATESFSSFSSMRALRRMPGGVVAGGMRGPSIRASTVMVSRVMPASGPVSRRSSPSRRLISVDLPDIGAADHRDADRAVGVARLRSRVLVFGRARGVLGQRGADRVVEIGQALAVLGRDRDRIAEAERIGLGGAALRRAPSLLLATTITGLPVRRTTSANARSIGVRPERTSIRNRIASAPRDRELRSAPSCGR